MELFKMGGTVSKRTATIISFIGLVVLLFIWHFITVSGMVASSILPQPLKVLNSFGELFNNFKLLPNIGFSLKLNLWGYVEAIAIALPLGFLIGLFPFFRNLLSKYIDAVRFIPLTAVTGLFIAWFGIEVGMKIHFLAFGILIYLLPIIVQRIDEVEKVHTQTIWTLGATNWQSFRHVYYPSVMSKIFDDIRIIVAISWTYIIVAELINKEGGIGALIYTATKQSRIDMVFALLIIIIVIGILQDVLFKWMDRLFFPHKYDKQSLFCKTKKLISK